MNQRRRANMVGLIVGLGTLVSACSAENSNGIPTFGGSPAATGGTRATTGGKTTSGGATSEGPLGGAPSAGGSTGVTNTGGVMAGGGRTGGTSGSGGRVMPTGGVATDGGRTGGTSTGGSTPSGGASNTNTGGVATGGGRAGGTSTGGSIPSGGASNTNTGGVATGGGSAGGTGTGGGTTGGKASGGTSTGGAATGGKASGGTSTGGAATGGKASGGTGTGGAATGGKASGGTSTGGAATGGKASGGTSTGGAAQISKFVGNITTRDAVDPSGLKYSKYWDQITPENAGKWGSVQSTASAGFNWTVLDRISDYAKTNNIIFKQHCFVWGPQQPTGTLTLANVENWIKSFCQRYPDVKLIDVVNEPPPHTTPSYTSALGAGEGGSYPWITKAFKLARQYCPSAILILNDYNNIEYTDQRNHFVDIVKDIKANGAPIDAVGCQAHGLKGASASTTQANLAYLNSQTGLPIYITEFDIDDASDSGQLSSYQAQVPFFLSTSYIHGVTVWGWIVGSTWETNSGLVNGTSPRSAMTWLMQQLGRPIPPN